MQRSFSSSSADHHRSSAAPCRHLPVRLVYNNTNDYQHQSYLQRVSSSSSFSSTSSTASASYRILPVRYSSVDRILPNLPIISANERGINVRIHLDRPHKHHHHHHHHRQHNNTEEYEHLHRKHMTKEHQHYDSCPTLDQNTSKSKLGSSNITYIETRSIVRDCSNDRINNPNKSPIASTRIKHIPFNPNCISTRVIREEEE
jgi:hypothetical protein